MNYLNSIRAVLDETGAIKSQYDYDPYGKQNEIVPTGAVAGLPPRDSWIGKEKDIESSLGDFGVRE